MIKEIKGDLLTSGADILCHQTNYVGVMGGGIAHAIKTKLLTSEQYKEYQTYCRIHGSMALGAVQFICLNSHQYVANIFSQDDFYAKSKDTITDYGAMEKALIQVEKFASREDLTVAIPGYMGCGIAGGNWDRVYGIIERVFRRSQTNCMIVYKE